MLDPGDMPGEDDVRERGPGRDERPAAEIAREQVHARSGEDVARKRRQVERRDLPDHVRGEVRRVVSECDLNVERVRPVPTERGSGERVVRRAKEVIATLVLRVPEPRNGCRGVGARVAGDRGAEMDDERPKERADEGGGPEQHQSHLRNDGTRARCQPRGAAQARS